ncbi:MAG: hypothetical protein COT74_04985 [Bdellovibrionales bacterium CG10_big_fil_rev_8_21_14_0_10_45_34]|nr:MAG: hypothetical protein COT74_04985 [Bdellovibrionales bacterium CG10_big_fil_rev_8_21_14_0_10_45_34]
MNRKRRSHDEEPNLERWLVSYADFITLLFAFFTVLYATSTHDEEKQKQFEESIRAAFAALVQLPGTSGQGDHNRFDPLGSPIPPPINLFPRGRIGAELEDQIRTQLASAVKKEVLDEIIVGIYRDDQGLHIAFNNEMLFLSENEKLRREVFESLKTILAILVQGAEQIIVEGHAANNTRFSKAVGNLWNLTSARATSLLRFVVEISGFPIEKISMAAYADNKPLVRNPESSKERNNRTEVIIVR